MLVSYKWLQEHFEDPLPPVEELVDLLTLNAYEIEEFNTVGEDIVIDVDVLPNRSHDSLCHRGIAREIGILLKRDYSDTILPTMPIEKNGNGNLTVSIEDAVACPRYIGKVVRKIEVGESPKWLKEYLEVLGQRSINVVVDITNYVMLETGQPMHAFDADKLVSLDVHVRKAKEGEYITTLDDKEVDLDTDTLIIADAENLLAIAGIKGGNHAEVDKKTKNIVLESANFNSIETRKTSRRIGIQTDSSKRFENEISTELAGTAMEIATALVGEYCGKEVTFYESVDIYPRKPHEYKVGVSISDVNSLLGSEMKETDVENVLNQLHFSYEKIENQTTTVVALASTLVGTPYVLGASITYDAPDAFDCSSFTSYLYSQAGIAIPRMVIDQFVYGSDVKKDDMKAGDIIFSNTGIGKTYSESIEWMPETDTGKEMDHCGLYLGDGKIIHASRHNGHDGEVKIEKFVESKQFKDIVGIKRMTDVEEVRYVVTCPHERLDLRITPDMVEEIGRIYGYDSIKPVIFSKENEKVNKAFYYQNAIRNILTDEGFSEVLTYVFTQKGDVEVANPIVKNKRYLRNSLSYGFEESLELNTKNADLLGLDIVRIFEIGTVFQNVGEKYVLGLGMRMTKSYSGKDKKQFKKEPELLVKSILEIISKLYGVEVVGQTTLLSTNDGVIVEIDLSTLVEKLPEVESYDDVLSGHMQTSVFKSISTYPFMTRDIAVFVPVTIDKKEIEKILIEKSGTLLVRPPKLFDVFTKTFEDGNEKTSYAYRLVFQSLEKTLTDEEINEVMDTVYKTLSQQEGWEIR